MTNPLMGWAPWSTALDIKQPHTLVYVDLTWREFEPQRGMYDFESFERENLLDKWRMEGKRVVFRFICDYPGKKPHLDIPDWLYSETNGDGDHYDHEYGKGYSPNYSNPTFIRYHQEAIKMLGEKYGQDDFFAYIQLGSLGHWGEWHVKKDSRIQPLPPEDIRDRYVLHYIESFPNTHLLMRRPFTIASRYDLGLYNDMTGDPEATSVWLDLIEKGGIFNQTGEANSLSPMPDGWKYSPIGGEQTFSMSMEEIFGKNLNQTLQLIKTSHTTFIGPGGPYMIEEGDILQYGINQVLETMGYRLYIQKVKLPRWVHFFKTIPVSIVFGNDGIAPIYFNWPVFFYIIDGKENIRSTSKLEMDIRKILPGDFNKYSLVLPVDQLENGIYTIGVAIIDPITNNPAVKFAMENPKEDLIQELGTFEVNRLDVY